MRGRTPRAPVLIAFALSAAVVRMASAAPAEDFSRGVGAPPPTRWAEGSKFDFARAATLAAAEVRLDASEQASPSSQEEPVPLEVYTGYAFLRDQAGDVSVPYGWSVAVATPFRTSWLSLQGDVGGSYYRASAGIESNIYTFLGGAKITLPLKGLSTYATVLAGVARSSSGFSGDAIPGVPTGPRSDVAVQGGLGLDLRLSRRFSLRTGVDVRSIFVEGGTVGQIRVIGGVVFRPLGGGASEESSQSPPAPTPSAAPPRPTSPPPPAPAQEPEPAPTTPPPAPAPPPRSPDVVPGGPAGSFARGQDLLRRGDYDAAAGAFVDYVRSSAAGKYAVALGTFCETENVRRQVERSGGAQGVFLLPVSLSGRSCYRLLWGIYETYEEALRAVRTVPTALRARGQIPVALERLPP